MAMETEREHCKSVCSFKIKIQYFFCKNLFSYQNIPRTCLFLDYEQQSLTLAILMKRTQAGQCSMPSKRTNQRDMFSNMKVAFLPKNTPSRTQCLDAGVIKNWRVKFRKKLLQYVCSQTGGTNVHKKATVIFESIDLLKATRQIEQAWQEVDLLAIVKCWSKVGVCCSD